ncbi:tyrosine-type recombinase/integrase [Beggiatoa leptomitoformis]|uniref:Tyrosine-type recombinase/integrase n=1 Tax=Beggiatoa leptomitoformis TaxID=288004 RepID=A0A2N9YBS3_9GAMM|nr:site-specific integrase [Beggiatoa leptomitoformis]AUI67896.1 tyrosine-type recombinase/integrase [Beggiatoa leptomitoformis]QGX03492.1 tyrosine-type recombinase/integrase [Beggiatoa leptomitoformis]
MTEILFTKALEDYLNETKSRVSHPIDLSRSKHLMNHFQGLTVQDIKRTHVRQYVKQRKQANMKPHTINGELRLISGVINQLNYDNDWNLPNPTLGCREKKPRGRKRWATEAEAKHLIQAASESKNRLLLPFIQLALSTGMRKGEILNLRWAQIDWEAKTIYLNQTKNGDPAAIPLNRYALHILNQLKQYRVRSSTWLFSHPNGERLQNIKTSFGTACRKAKIEGLTIHDLRRTVGSWLINGGERLEIVQDVLRHRDIGTTREYYAHLEKSKAREALEKLDNTKIYILEDTNIRKNE